MSDLGDKKGMNIAVTVCSGVCNGMDLMKENPYIVGRETKVGTLEIGEIIMQKESLETREMEPDGPII